MKVLSNAKKCKGCIYHAKSVPQYTHWENKPRIFTFHYCTKGCPGVESFRCKYESSK